MRLFECQHCRNPVHFENSQCVVCGHALGFLPARLAMTALETAGDGTLAALADPGRPCLYCDNAVHGACNWLIPAEDGPGLCRACRHNRLIPDIDSPANRERWARLELAKRQLFYSLLRWRLPLADRTEAPETGLAFDFVADVVNPDGSVDVKLTAHDNGLVTINIAEADDAERESRRTALGERYRTLLGHLRHEVGHYYWSRLVEDGGPLDACRALFGDERADYGEALQRHYAEGAPADWRDRFISAYAASHPWEDFAETWAHYVHMVDALETAAAFGLRIRPRIRNADELEAEIDFDPYRARDAEALVDAWVPLTVAVNSINRSMGQPDLYPFVLSTPVMQKLQFIHALIQGASAR